MPTIFSFPQDIIGEDYLAFIEAAVERFDAFTLSWPQKLPPAASLHTISLDLRGHELGREQDMILYRLDHDAIPVLLQPGSLFGWRLPNYPENLTFYREGRSGFSSFQDSAFITDTGFARSLPSSIRLTEETVSESLLQKVS